MIILAIEFKELLNNFPKFLVDRQIIIWELVKKLNVRDYCMFL